MLSETVVVPDWVMLSVTVPVNDWAAARVEDESVNVLT